MAKATHAQARYQHHPKGEDCCELCTMYRPPASCTAVVGPIEARGYCNYFKRSATKKPPMRAGLKGTY